MMKISTKSRYGMRLLLDIAIHSKKQNVLLKDSAKRLGLSIKYLGHLVIPLIRSGLILSSRSQLRGYYLSKKPEKISMLSIIEILEGEISSSECVRNPAKCDQSAYCRTRIVWCKLDESIKNTLSSICIQDLIEIHNSNESIVYFI